MWYFAWLLGLPLAAGFAILNAMWFELMEDDAAKRAANGQGSAGTRR
jgi:cyd operon protein YbgT